MRTASSSRKRKGPTVTRKSPTAAKLRDKVGTGKAKRSSPRKKSPKPGLKPSAKVSRVSQVVRGRKVHAQPGGGLVKDAVRARRAASGVPDEIAVKVNAEALVGVVGRSPAAPPPLPVPIASFTF